MAFFLFLFFFFLQRPASGINGLFIKYTILYKTDGESEQTKNVQGFSTTTTALGSLKIWTEYTIKIRVQNDKGLGPASAEKVQRTEEAGMQLFPDICSAQLLVTGITFCRNQEMFSPHNLFYSNSPNESES